MEYRKDTVAAGEFILAVERTPRRYIATVGKVYVFPNGTNVIAGDSRDIDENVRNQILRL